MNLLEPLWMILMMMMIFSLKAGVFVFVLCLKYNWKFLGFIFDIDQKCGALMKSAANILFLQGRRVSGQVRRLS